MSDGVTGNTTDFGSVEYRFDSYSDNDKKRISMSVEKSKSKVKETCKFSREEQKKIFNQTVGNFSVEPVIIQTHKNK